MLIICIRTILYQYVLVFQLGRPLSKDQFRCGKSSTSLDNDHVKKISAVICETCRLNTCKSFHEGRNLSNLCHIMSLLFYFWWGRASGGLFLFFFFFFLFFFLFLFFFFFSNVCCIWWRKKTITELSSSAKSSFIILFSRGVLGITVLGALIM